LILSYRSPMFLSACPIQNSSQKWRACSDLP